MDSKPIHYMAKWDNFNYFPTTLINYTDKFEALVGQLTNFACKMWQISLPERQIMVYIWLKQGTKWGIVFYYWINTGASRCYKWIIAVPRHVRNGPGADGIHQASEFTPPMTLSRPNLNRYTLNYPVSLTKQPA
jgi:hypothetical protein